MQVYNVPWHYDNTQRPMADQQNACSLSRRREKQIKSNSLTMAFTQQTEKTRKSTLSKCFNVLQTMKAAAQLAVQCTRYTMQYKTYHAAKDIPCTETNVKRRCSCSISLADRQQKIHYSRVDITSKEYKKHCFSFLKRKCVHANICLETYNLFITAHASSELLSSLRVQEILRPQKSRDNLKESCIRDIPEPL